MDNYEQYRSVYKNTGTVPRTLHDAYRDGEYGYSIHLFKDDASRAWDFCKDALIGFLAVAVVSSVALGFLVWLGVV